MYTGDVQPSCSRLVARQVLSPRVKERIEEPKNLQLEGTALTNSANPLV